MHTFEVSSEYTSARALELVKKQLGYDFIRKDLLELALTHSSWANECGSGQEHNERQEFLGDAVLELCVSWEVYRRFPVAREGELTKMRSGLVSAVSLAERAREMGLDSLLKLGRGEESQGGRKRDAVLSDALEAVLAAIYEDGGFAATQEAVARIFAGQWPDRAGDGKASKDYKTRLQESSQQRFGQAPLYTRVGSHGPEHSKVFEVVLRLPDGSEFSASGSSCKKAEQQAARIALEAPDKTE